MQDNDYPTIGSHPSITSKTVMNSNDRFGLKQVTPGGNLMEDFGLLLQPVPYLWKMFHDVVKGLTIAVVIWVDVYCLER